MIGGVGDISSISLILFQTLVYQVGIFYEQNPNAFLCILKSHLYWARFIQTAFNLVELSNVYCINERIYINQDNTANKFCIINQLRNAFVQSKIYCFSPRRTRIFVHKLNINLFISTKFSNYLALCQV